MRVVHLLKTSDGAIWAHKLFLELKKSGIELLVIVPKSKGRLIDKLEESNINYKVVNLNTKRPLSLIIEMKKLKEIIKIFQPHIIHSHFVLTTFLYKTFRYENKIPFIFQVPGPLHLEHKLFAQIDKALGRKNDYWIASCKWTYNKYLKMGIPEDKLFLSFYGTDVEQYKTVEKTDYLIKELNLNEKAFLVGIIAYMYPPKKYLKQKVGLKGHEDFIEAISIARKKNQNVYGIIVGNEWGNGTKYEQSLIELAQKKCSDGVKFLGFRSDISEIYSSLDVAVHPSLSENLGGAAESLLCGIPTISTNIGGFPDIVINDKTGWTVDVNDPESIAKKINFVIENKEKVKSIKLNGRNHAKNILDITKTGLEITNIYNEIFKKDINFSLSGD